MRYPHTTLPRNSPTVENDDRPRVPIPGRFPTCDSRGRVGGERGPGRRRTHADPFGSSGAPDRGFVRTGAGGSRSGILTAAAAGPLETGRAAGAGRGRPSTCRRRGPSGAAVEADRLSATA